MTRPSTTAEDCRIPLCRRQPGSGHCYRELTGRAASVHNDSAEAVSSEDAAAEGDELDDQEPNDDIADDALFELDGPDDDEPLPEYGDFWIDTDDVDVV